jgi:glycosyltransferase involved in cell wall biosynthesis
MSATSAATGAPRTARLAEARLGLFLTAGVSLATWADIGILAREVKLYTHLAAHLREVGLVTYGGSRDLAFAASLAPVKVLPVSWRRWRAWTRRELHRRHGAALRAIDILKTNQLPGAEVALGVQARYGAKLIVRCGYPYSRNVEYEGARRSVVQAAVELERRAFASADLVVMTSPRNRQWAIDRHGLPPEKVRVIPNFVDTDVFRPAPATARYDIVAVGRAGREKNFGQLLQAVRQLADGGTRLRVVLIGGCASDPALRQAAAGLAVEFPGIVPNETLPRFLCESRVFVLPSLYEGHPKALLEAMSCGLACVGTDVVGIRDEIEHGVTGYLCETSADSIAAALAATLDDNELRRRLGDNARRHVLERYALERVVGLELDALDEALRT